MKMKRVVFVLSILVLLASNAIAFAETPKQVTKIGDTTVLPGGYVSTVVGFLNGKALWKVNLAAPQYLDDLKTKIDTQWKYDSKTDTYTSGANKFIATVANEAIRLLSTSHGAAWDSSIKLDNVKQGKLNKATLLAIDPLNSNYKNNTLEWKFSNGISKRLRIIEGLIEEYYVINSPLNKNVTITSSFSKTAGFKYDKKASAYDSNKQRVDITEDADHNITLTKDKGNDSKIKYPIIIDPTVVFVTSASDGYIQGQDAIYTNASSTVSTSGDVATQFFIGQDYFLSLFYIIRRSYVFFDTSALPDTSTITSATLSLYTQSNSSDTDFNIQIQNGQTTYPHDPLDNADYPLTNYSGNGGTLNTSTLGVPAYYNITLSSDGLSWINKTGTTKLALFSNRDIAGTVPTGGEYVGFYSFEKGIGFYPQLSVTYSYGVPVVTTTSVTSTSGTTATATGSITDTGGINATARGVCYSSINNPSSITDSTVTEYGSYGVGAFSENITGLSAGTTYYARMFATNSSGTSYGNTVSFSSALAVETIAASGISITGVSLQGNLISLGGAASCNVSFSYGLTLGYDTDTAVQNYLTKSSFNQTLTGLMPNTLYHYRAVATDGSTTVYGNDATFTTTVTTGSGIFPEVTPVVDVSDAVVLLNLASDPLYALVNVINEATNIPITLIYRMAYFLLSLIGFLLTYKYTHHLSFSTVSPLLIWGYGLIRALIPWWGYIALLLLAIGLSVTEGRQNNG